MHPEHLKIAEKNYSQIEKGVMAVVYGVNNFYQYLYMNRSLKFTLAINLSLDCSERIGKCQQWLQLEYRGTDFGCLRVHHQIQGGEEELQCRWTQSASSGGLCG